MKCNCTLNNNFKVVGLCDVKKFNQKISEFKDKSWTEIIISEILNIPKSFPNIEDVTKAYADIKITSTRIINTPMSEIPNTEGLTLTGKKLLISGHLCENIVYISDTSCQSIHSVNFKIEFNTYIVIEGDIDIELDKFCVYPCIENVYINPLNKRSLKNSITLFLFAHKIKRPVVLLPNSFEFFRYDDDIVDVPPIITPIVKIEFDNANKELIATSTGNAYLDSNPDPLLPKVFKFYLKNSDNSKVKASGFIKYNENADDFVKVLNNKEFEEGDLILIEYARRRETILTNYPREGENYIFETFHIQSFKIEKNQIRPNKLPNQIILNSVDDTKPVFLIGFDKLTKRFLVNVPTNEVANPAFKDKLYFSFRLYGDNNTSLYFAAGQLGGETAFKLYHKLMERAFEFGNIIRLFFEESNKLLVTNYPNMGDTYHFSTNPNIKEIRFRITENGLQLYIYKLPNIIVIKSINNIEVTRIEFNKNTKKFIAEGTTEYPDESSIDVYFTFTLKNNDETVEKLKSELLSNAPDTSFEEAINEKPFEYGDKLIISYKDKSKIKIVNYPREGEQYTPDMDTKTFIITEEGLK